MRQFSFSIKNTSGATQNVALVPAYFDTLAVQSATVEGAIVSTTSRSNAAQIAAAGFTVDAVLDDGAMLSGLEATAANSKFRIRDFLRYVLLNSALIKKMTVACANTDAYEKTITIVRVNPTGNQGEEYVHLTNFYNVQQYNDDKIVINNLNLEISDESLMLLPIDTGRTVTITLHF